MDKYINADEFKKKLRKRHKAGIIGRNTLICEFKAINEMPSADVVEVKRGKWEYDCICDMFICSQCGGAMVRNVYPYCSWCGANMRGETE